CTHSCAARSPHTAANRVCVAADWLARVCPSLATFGLLEVTVGCAGGDGAGACPPRFTTTNLPTIPSDSSSSLKKPNVPAVVGVKVTTDVWPDSASAFKTLVLTYLARSCVLLSALTKLMLVSGRSSDDRL